MRSSHLRLERLTPQQLDAYSAWRDARHHWMRRLFNDRADALYEAILDGWEGPQMPHDIKQALLPTTATTTADANVDSLRAIYERMAMQ